MTKEDIQAERTRVMLESLGAACHHLGGPATVVQTSLRGLEQITGDSDAAVKDLVKKGLKAAAQIGDILHKLNMVNEYRTETLPGSAGTKIIAI